MKFSNRYFKRLAHKTLINQYRIPVIACLLIILLNYLLIIPFYTFSLKHNNIFGLTFYLISTYFVSFISALFYCGFLKLLFGMIRNEPFKISDIFYFFKNHPDRVIIVTFIVRLPTFIIQISSIYLNFFLLEKQNLNLGINIIVLLLLAITSIILWLNFSLIGFLLVDRPNLKPLEVLKESSKLLHGNRLKLIVLSLSYIGLLILATISLFGVLWILPHYLTSFCYFYLYLTKQLPKDSIV